MKPMKPMILLSTEVTYCPRGVWEGSLLEAVGAPGAREAVGGSRAGTVAAILGGSLAVLVVVISAMMGFVIFMNVIPK